MHQSSTSSLIGCFKTDNRTITSLFQGEVKHLNLTNYNFSRALDLFRFIKHAIIKLIDVTFSRLHTLSQVLGFKYKILPFNSSSNVLNTQESD